MNIKDIVRMLRNAPRMGAEKDDPEGTRFIQVSDSLANEIVQELESWIDSSEWELVQPNDKDYTPPKIVSTDDLKHFLE